MALYHFGIGLAAIIAAYTQSVWQLAASIAFIGVFAAIYHPVGIAMLIKNNHKIGFRLGVNGVFGNMGVAAAPLITGHGAGADVPVHMISSDESLLTRLADRDSGDAGMSGGLSLPPASSSSPGLETLRFVLRELPNPQID